MFNHCLLVLTITILFIIDCSYIHGITPAYVNFGIIINQLLAPIFNSTFVTFKFKLCFSSSKYFVLNISVYYKMYIFAFIPCHSLFLFMTNSISYRLLNLVWID